MRVSEGSDLESVRTRERVKNGKAVEEYEVEEDGMDIDEEGDKDEDELKAVGNGKTKAGKRSALAGRFRGTGATVNGAAESESGRDDMIAEKPKPSKGSGRGGRKKRAISESESEVEEPEPVETREKAYEPLRLDEADVSVHSEHRDVVSGAFEVPGQKTRSYCTSTRLSLDCSSWGIVV